MAEAFQPLDGRATRLAGTRRGDLLRLVPGVTLALFLAPIGAGLLGTWLPAFGYFPALGGSAPSLEPWRRLLDHPGLAQSVWLSLTSGLLATVTSLALALGFVAACHDRPVFARIRRGLAPLLAVPHVAMAIGLAFLIAPSGWLPRLVSPWATGWDLPPDVATVQDPHGFALALGLVLKETPFLLLMTLSALERCAAAERLAVARSLGYGPVQAWFKTVLPAVYPLIRLPVYAVLAFALSVVDMALILGPATPPPLAVQVFRWANDPDLALRFPAAAGATLQLFLVVGAIGAWRLLELLVARLGRRWIAGGRRGGDGRPVRRLTGGTMALAGALAGGAILSLAIWSVTRRWRYPDALPSEWSLETWRRHGDALLWTGGTTLVLGLAAAIAALILVLGCLENEQ
ncbi:MAG TPA: ABC transporter permease, partial [Kiloniellales bacterium]|nr:ABC transporter permease [Kiloniellales bacterium]